MTRPLTVVVLNGWSSISRGRETRTHLLVERELDAVGADYTLLGLKSMLISARSRKVKKYIQSQEHRNRTLVCFGKSLGARNMVQRVLNTIGPLRYHEIHLMTIDPNWPEHWDLTPNLNGHTLRLTHTITRATNIYYLAPKGSREQAGALLGAPKGVPTTNHPVKDCDHVSIVQHPKTAKLVRQTIEEAMK